MYIIYFKEMMKVASSKSGIITIEDYDENKHPWVKDKTSPLGDKLKSCQYHSKPIEIITKEAESWDEDPEIETKINYNNPAKWAIWNSNICYDTCHIKSHLSVQKEWYFNEYINTVAQLTEINSKFLENSKELYKINNSIKILTSKRDVSDSYYVTLKEAIKEAENEVLKYRDSKDEIDIEKYKKSVKNLNIITRQFNNYTSSSASTNVMSEIYTTKTQLEKSVEYHMSSIRIKLQILIENYMIEMDNGNKEDANKIFKEINKYTDIISLDEYEKIYKNKCDTLRKEQNSVNIKDTQSKYTQSVLKRD